MKPTHLFSLLFIIVTLLQACSKKDPEPVLTLNPGGLFTYRIVAEGDGLVSFAADSTQSIHEFVWDFGDATTPVTTATGKTTHTFTKNAAYSVKLTAKNGNSQLSDTKAVTVDTRLARTFADVPTGERDTIRVLYVLTSLDDFYGYRAIANNPKSIEVNNYQNQIFSQFLQRTLPNHPKEFDKLTFKNIVYVLPVEDTLKWNKESDPDGFLKNLLTKPQDATYQKILTMKRKVAASRIIFMMNGPRTVTKTPTGTTFTYKYNYAGYALYEGSYIASFNGTGVVPHEMCHSFGFAHDTERDSRYWPLLMAPETKVVGTEPLIWTNYRELQVNGFSHNLLKIKLLPPYGGHSVIPDYWKSLFPDNPVVEKFTLKDIATTPYYKGGIDLVRTLSDAFITQYNLKRSPNSFNSISENLKISGGRISYEAIDSKLVYCR